MDFQFRQLTREFLATHVEEFIQMINRNLEDEYWVAEHFLTELPGKWKFSFYVSASENLLAGFIIASEKPGSIHIHKFVVDGPYQKQGLGSQMVDWIINQSEKPVTLKVRTSNESGLRFYLRKGFIVTAEHGNFLLMTYHR